MQQTVDNGWMVQKPCGVSMSAYLLVGDQLWPIGTKLDEIANTAIPNPVDH